MSHLKGCMELSSSVNCISTLDGSHVGQLVLRLDHPCMWAMLHHFLLSCVNITWHAAATHVPGISVVFHANLRTES